MPIRTLQFLLFTAIIMTALVTFDGQRSTWAQTSALDSSASNVSAISGVDKPNVLLIIGDDMGVDTMGLYGLSDDPANTPNLDALAAQGVVMNNMWATPVCSSTRAALLTGQHGVHNGVPGVPGTLPDGSMIIHNHLSQLGYANAAFGKWHLTGRRSGSDHPNSFGIEHYEGALQGNVKDYYNWTKTTNGVESQVRVYNTTALTSAAVNWIGAQDRPWFVWLAYAAPHGPIHKPPAELHTRSLGDVQPRSDGRNHHLAAIEAMDTEIGRLVRAIPEDERANTVIMFVGDNGTPRGLRDRDVYPQHAKKTLYEGGVRVPFIVSGVNIESGQDNDALANIVDIFPTVAQWAGSTASRVDGVSLAGVLSGDAQSARAYNYMELDDGWTVRDASHKFIRHEDGSEELYDMTRSYREIKNIIKDSENTVIAKRLKQQGLNIRN